MFDDETRVSTFDGLDTLVFEVKNASEIFKAVNGKPVKTIKSERKVPLQGILKLLTELTHGSAQGLVIVV